MQNSEDIYFYQALKPKVNTSVTFEIAAEGEKLRVKNQHVSCLFSNLTAKTFDQFYNDFVQHLNLDFAPVVVNGHLYQLKPSEQDYLTQTIITNWIYFYTINNLPVKVKRDDFNHPCMVDHVLELLDRKFGVDTAVSLAVGASILRQELKIYGKAVAGRRRHYDR